MLPVQMIILLEVGETIAARPPIIMGMLPEEVTRGRLENIALPCVQEARATFSKFCAKIAREASKHTGLTTHPVLIHTAQSNGSHTRGMGGKAFGYQNKLAGLLKRLGLLDVSGQALRMHCSLQTS